MFTPLTHHPTVGSTKTYGEILKGLQQGISSKYPRAALPELRIEYQFSLHEVALGRNGTHIYVVAPRRTKRVLSQCYGPLIILQKLGHTIRLALDK